MSGAMLIGWLIKRPNPGQKPGRELDQNPDPKSESNQDPGTGAACSMREAAEGSAGAW